MNAATRVESHGDAGRVGPRSWCLSVRERRSSPWVRPRCEATEGGSCRQRFPAPCASTATGYPHLPAPATPFLETREGSGPHQQPAWRGWARCGIQRVCGAALRTSSARNGAPTVGRAPRFCVSGDAVGTTHSYAAIGL